MNNPVKFLFRVPPPVEAKPLTEAEKARARMRELTAAMMEKRAPVPPNRLNGLISSRSLENELEDPEDPDEETPTK